MVQFGSARLDQTAVLVPLFLMTSPVPLGLVPPVHWLGLFLAWPGEALPCLARLGVARLGLAMPGLAWPDHVYVRTFMSRDILHANV